MGRFISADTIAPGKGDPQNRNRYSYALNNPLKYTDPTGHCAKDGSDGDSVDDCRQAEQDLGNRGIRITNLWEWDLSHLLYSIGAIDDLLRVASWTFDDFKNATGGIVFNRVSSDLKGDGSIAFANVLPGFKRIDFYGDAFKEDVAGFKRLVVHEIAHTWDGWEQDQSKSMAQQTGSSWDWFSWSYTAKGVPASKYGATGGEKEDWAEAVAADVYPTFYRDRGFSPMDPERQNYVHSQYRRFSTMILNTPGAR